MSDQCYRCRGTGSANAARDMGMEDYPLMMRPLGVYQCPDCGGDGLTHEARRRKWEESLTPEQKQQMHDDFMKVMEEHAEAMEKFFALKKS